ncbi:hypothetical protein AGRA3207_001258 [Actinomadura graeca]|uniref:Insertion element protein n=1 Tax=Actinomadura graeca TaxID=2750812 RepID=A0ABX8QRC9_9ACTN|nr:hypothetical protein [Actinomadura graeca]QXJ20529.1 hypothetical protein AGRA3207_001258 [Actinomadura graeca]
MSERAAPFYCPYCGEENLEPLAPSDLPGGGGGPSPRKEEGAAWFCHDCVRSFRLKFLGVGAPRTHKEDPR